MAVPRAEYLDSMSVECLARTRADQLVGQKVEPMAQRKVGKRVVPLAALRVAHLVDL